ncbi:hypothetical protein QMK24_34310 [Streptomyces sp. PH10-H1]|nr:hypothetical protein [Streptomyces sp. H10-C2]MDJ0346431.1 hypothetical protein [Streptomyces sp. PH10-H1]
MASAADDRTMFDDGIGVGDPLQVRALVPALGSGPTARRPAL